MKNKKTWILFTAILVVLVLAVCGCGKKKEDVTPATTEANQETKKETKEETKAETKEETKSETKEESPEPDDQGGEYYGPSDDECRKLASSLLMELQYTTKVGAGQLAVDRSVVYTGPEGFNYYLVTEARIQSFYDIYMMLYDNFTNSCVDNHWSFMTNTEEGNAPFIIFLQEEDLPTGLYLIDAGHGYMDYTPTGNIEIRHVDDTCFHAIVPFSQFNQNLYLDMEIVLDDSWKINEFEVLE